MFIKWKKSKYLDYFGNVKLKKLLPFIKLWKMMRFLIFASSLWKNIKSLIFSIFEQNFLKTPKN